MTSPLTTCPFSFLQVITLCPRQCLNSEHPSRIKQKRKSQKASYWVFISSFLLFPSTSTLHTTAAFFLLLGRHSSQVPSFGLSETICCYTAVGPLYNHLLWLILYWLACAGVWVDSPSGNVSKPTIWILSHPMWYFGSPSLLSDAPGRNYWTANPTPIYGIKQQKAASSITPRPGYDWLNLMRVHTKTPSPGEY